MSVDLRGRLGLSVPPVSPGVVWVHAASVGEVGAAEGLIPHLEGRVLLTADTATGAARARGIAEGSGGRVVAGVCPLDLPWTLAPLWAEARPRALVFVEGTYWPVLGRTARGAGVPVLRVSAKAGGRTRQFPWLQRLFPSNRIIARDEGEAAFFRAAGHPDVRVGGDLKLSRALLADPLSWSRPFVAGASTRPGDEDALLAAFLEIRADLPEMALLLAARHPGRFGEVAGLLGRSGLKWRRRSELPGGLVPPEVDVVLLDTLGELAGILRSARVAFVGGTFDAAIGGHSPAEAMRAGVPVVCGPHTSANAALFEESGAISAASPRDLAGALRRAIDSPPLLTAPSDDPAARTASLAADLLDASPAPESCPRPWLAPIGAIFASIAVLRRRLTAPVRLPVPVISIGSTNARGPGKTPTALWFARRLRERGHTVGVVVRGYRRTRGGSDVRTSAATRVAADLGDEGALFAADGFLVAAGPDRVTGGRALIGLGATVLVLDDGLQHVRLARDLDILVLDARFPEARGLLPAGERREFQAIPARISGIVLHHADQPGATRETGMIPGAILARRRPGPWWPAEPPPGPVAAFAGVARPADFLASLDRPVARFRALPDHAPIPPGLARELLAWAGDLPLLTTAKDAARWPSGIPAPTWRDVELDLEGVPESWLALPGP